MLQDEERHLFEETGLKERNQSPKPNFQYEEAVVAMGVNLSSSNHHNTGEIPMDKPIGLSRLSQTTYREASNTSPNQSFNQPSASQTHTGSTKRSVKSAFVSQPEVVKSTNITAGNTSLFAQMKETLMDFVFEPAAEASLKPATALSESDYVEQNYWLNQWENNKPNYDFIFQPKMETVPVPRFTDYQFGGKSFGQPFNQIS